MKNVRHRFGELHLRAGRHSPPVTGQPATGAYEEAATVTLVDDMLTEEGTGAAAELAAPPATRVSRAAGRIGRASAAIALAVQGLTLIGLAGVVVAAIVMRYLLHNALTAEDDVVALLFMWLTFVGIGRECWTRGHVRLSLLGRRTRSVQIVREGFYIGALIAFFSLVAMSFVTTFNQNAHVLIPTLGVPEYVETISVMVGCALGAVSVGARAVHQRTPWPAYVLAAAVCGAVWAWVSQGTPTGMWDLLIVLILTLLDVPLVVTLGLGGIALVTTGGFTSGITVPVGQLVSAVQPVAYIALPLFMLLGGIVAKSGLAQDLSRFLRAALGRLPGGTGVSCVGAAALLANMTGSPLADTAALGSVFIPELQRAGYNREESAGLQACAGLLGLVFPPAVTLIVYATLVDVSVTDQFLAVIIPGGLLAVGMAAVVVAQAIKHGGRRAIPAPNPATAPHRNGLTALTVAFAAAIPVLLIPAILDGGIFSGIFAAYEAGGVAIVAAVILGMAKRSIRRQHFVPIIKQAADTTTMVVIILASLGVLQYGMFTSGISDRIDSILKTGAGSTLAFWIVVNLVFIALHEFLEPIPAILLVAPFLVPVAAHLGISLIQVGVVIVINSTIGLVLPPLGINLYLAARLAGANPQKVLRKVWPYLASTTIVLIATCAWPAISLTLR